METSEDNQEQKKQETNYVTPETQQNLVTVVRSIEDGDKKLFRGAVANPFLSKYIREELQTHHSGARRFDYISNMYLDLDTHRSNGEEEAFITDQTTIRQIRSQIGEWEQEYVLPTKRKFFQSP